MQRSSPKEFRKNHDAQSFCNRILTIDSTLHANTLKYAQMVSKSIKFATRTFQAYFSKSYQKTDIVKTTNVHDLAAATASVLTAVQFHGLWILTGYKVTSCFTVETFVVGKCSSPNVNKLAYLNFQFCILLHEHSVLYFYNIHMHLSKLSFGLKSVLFELFDRDPGPIHVPQSRVPF